MSATFFTASAVLFDLNGVLADSIPTLNNTYMEFLKQFGYEGNPEEFDTYLNGRSDREIVNYLKATYNLEQELTDLDEFFFLLSKKRYDENVAPFQDTIECLKFFKSNNFFLGLVTSSTRDVINDFLVKNAMDKYFEIILTGDKVSAGKPSPEIYINALSKLNFSETSVFIIEDSKNGITSAFKAGVMKIIGVGPKSSHVPLMKAGAMLTVESLKELMNLPWQYE